MIEDAEIERARRERFEGREALHDAVLDVEAGAEGAAMRRTDAVIACREVGISWAIIARELGIDEQAAREQRYGEDAPGVTIEPAR